MSEINKININSLTPAQKKEAKEKGLTKEEAVQEFAPKPEVNHKKATEVLDFMNNSAALNKINIQTQKPIGLENIDTSKYVDKMSEDRIAGMMKSFDETILKSAEVAIKEFGLPEGSAQDVAIMAFNQKFLS